MTQRIILIALLSGPCQTALRFSIYARPNKKKVCLYKRHAMYAEAMTFVFAGTCKLGFLYITGT